MANNFFQIPGKEIEQNYTLEQLENQIKNLNRIKKYEMK